MSSSFTAQSVCGSLSFFPAADCLKARLFSDCNWCLGLLATADVTLVSGGGHWPVAFWAHSDVHIWIPHLCAFASMCCSALVLFLLACFPAARSLAVLIAPLFKATRRLAGRVECFFHKVFFPQVPLLVQGRLRLLCKGVLHVHCVSASIAASKGASTAAARAPSTAASTSLNICTADMCVVALCAHIHK